MKKLRLCMQKGMQCPRIDGLLAEDPCALHQAVATGAQYMSIPIRELGHAIQLYDLLNYFPIQQYALLTHNSMLSYPETLLQRTAVGSAPYVLIVAGSPFRCTPAMVCLLYTSPSPRDRTRSRMPSSA